MERIALTPDELLATTRSVRKRLDLSRPVPMKILEECLHLALQAPTSSYGENWRFILVRDEEKKHGIAEWYRRGYDLFIERQSASLNSKHSESQRRRMLSSIHFLAQNIQDVPVLMIPCLLGRLDKDSGASDIAYEATMYASIIPAVWNFMLAGRARSLGTCWTTLHLPFEREVAHILGIPYSAVMQVALIPVAYTLGTKFKSAPRRPLKEILHLDQW